MDIRKVLESAVKAGIHETIGELNNAYFVGVNIGLDKDKKQEYEEYKNIIHDLTERYGFNNDTPLNEVLYKINSEK